MKLILKFSGEHPKLPVREFESVCKGSGINYSITKKEDFSFVDVDVDDHEFLKRLGFLQSASEHICESKNMEELAGQLFDVVGDASSFRITGSQVTQSKLGEYLCKMGLKVNLNQPEIVITTYQFDKMHGAGLKIQLHKHFEKRKPQNRPYFHPTSMHPKIARALVNLGQINVGDRILDPFCGTGGILIEAGLIGMEVMGWDIDEKMVEGTRENLKEYGLTGNIKVANALEEKTQVDCIVTDPPYGRASYTTKDVDTLYSSFITNARYMLDEGSIMVMMVPENHELAGKQFSVEETFDIRMHKSLTRRIWVLKAI